MSKYDQGKDKKKLPYKDNKISKNGRFEIKSVPVPQDHFYRPDLGWKVLDLETGETVCSFSGSWVDDDKIQEIYFATDERSVVGVNGHGEVTERIQLPE